MNAATVTTRSPQTLFGDVEESAAKPVKSWFSGFSFSLFGRKITGVDPQAGAASRATAQQAAKEKFPITNLSSFWSGTRITIPKNESSPASEAPTFNGTEQDAKELLQQLTKLQGKGMLVLKYSGDPKKEMEFQYRNFWMKPSVKQREETGAYIQSLLKKAYPNSESFSANKNNFQQIFSDYLSSPRTPITQDFSSSFESAFESHLTTSKTKEIENIPPRTTPINYLRSQKGVTIGTQIGEGGCGKVYAAKIGSKDYVYKQENKPVSLSGEPELNQKWWRHGDIAASRLKDLPYFAKSTAFILEITQPGGKAEQWYVSADQTKDFGKTLPKGTSVKLVGQLIERAPGKELWEHLYGKNGTGEGALSDKERLEHFNPISNQLFSFLEKSYARNLIHRDLKPENFMHAPETKQGTVIDCGLGGVYGKRHKMGPGITATQSGNPLRSNRFAGTPHYLAPEVVAGKFYGAEVDFHSAAVMLIQILSPREFARAGETFFSSKTGKFTGAKIPRSCDAYIQLCGNNSTLARTLRNNPAMKTTIDLFFRVASARAKNRDAAFQALKTHMDTVGRPATQGQRQQNQQPSRLPFINILDTLPDRAEDSDDDD